MPQTYFDMMTYIEIKRGYKTTLTISILNVIEPDSDMRNLLRVEERKCRYPDEVPGNMTFFAQYSQSGCTFECMAMHSKDICQCVPWDMIRNNDSNNLPICNGMGSHCFYENMNDNAFKDESCHCLPECKSTQYATVKVVEPLTENYCKARIQDEDSHIYSRLPIVSLLYDQFYEYIKNTKPEDWNHEYLHNTPRRNTIQRLTRSAAWFDDKMCKDWVINDMAVVEIHIKSPAYLKMTQSARVTFSDKISAIGGTLGLFTGFSLLALVEIVYWIIITIKNIVKLKPRRMKFQKSKGGFKEKINP